MARQECIYQDVKFVIGDIKKDKRTALAEEVNEDDACYKLDVSLDESWRKCVAFTEENFGLANCLANNLGFGIFKNLDQLTVDNIPTSFRVDELGVLLNMKAMKLSHA